jgi:hypothetical protein
MFDSSEPTGSKSESVVICIFATVIVGGAA